MGADIHVYTLYKNLKTDQFEEINLYTKYRNGKYSKAHLGEARNYKLFSKLAGVRGDEDRISVGHDGFIGNCPKNILEEYESYGGHTPVWFKWSELEQAALYEGMVEDFIFGNYNIIQDWLNELSVAFGLYYIFNTEYIYVQIFFDN